MKLLPKMSLCRKMHDNESDLRGSVKRSVAGLSALRSKTRGAKSLSGALSHNMLYIIAMSLSRLCKSSFEPRRQYLSD